MLDTALRLFVPEGYRLRVFRKLVESGRVEVGAHTYGIPEVRLFEHDDTRIRIGRYCSIAEDVRLIAGGNHPTDRLSTFPVRMRRGLPGAGSDGHPSSKGDIIVEHDVWIATGVTIVSGVTVGTGAVVGAGSVVTRDVAPYTIVAGNPARLVRPRLDPDVAQEMLDIAWWNWPDADVERFADELVAKDTRAALISLRRHAASLSS
ncbi:CatB-related O-acetyltransferase [Rhodococcoides corynebacterioides]|uniref:CatB-related O-acetyltransferase n=1 Tax=Rhodococcoides corynebacterioides TaxID=53972 RepID=UPI0008369A24|nr:CatB-related O-acetyltransferase [Rhodococcus corynebacterioides]